MRTTFWAVLGVAVAAGTGLAQGPAAPLPRLAIPLPGDPQFTPSAPLPPPRQFDPPDAPGPGLPGVTVFPPGEPVPAAASVLPEVRPPAPVAGPPIEVPPGPMVWGGVEYLLWRSKGGLLPPLITDVVSSGPDPLAAFPLSDSRINGDVRPGVRVIAGCWLDKPFGTGVEARAVGFFPAQDVAVFAGPPARVLSRPFWDALNNRPALFQLSTPTGSVVGAAQVQTAFDSWGLEGNMLRRGPAMFGEVFHWVIGARYWTLGEDLTVGAGSETGGLRAGLYDEFTTRNHFVGGQLGGLWNWTRNGLGIDLTWKLAAGGMSEQVKIRGGSSAFLPDGSLVNRPGGFLALASNSGTHSRVKLAFIRDVALGLSYCVTDNVVLRVAYEGTWVSNVVRPGEQADLLINPTLLPFSPARPTAPLLPGFRFNDETYWMHGFTFGVTVQF